MRPSNNNNNNNSNSNKQEICSIFIGSDGLLSIEMQNEEFEIIGIGSTPHRDVLLVNTK